MPQFMFKNPAGTGYLFRRGVPHDVRDIIHKREFKKSLGGDFKAACRECNRLAVETDMQIEAARESIRTRQVRIYNFYDSLTVIRDVTPELIARLRARVLATADAADLQRRAALEPEMSHEDVTESLRETGELARHAWATGHLDAFRPALHQTLHLAGHRLDDALLGTEHERTLLLEFVRAQRAAIGLMEARYAGDDPDIVWQAAPLQPADANAQTTSATASTTMMLSAAVADFIEHLRALPETPFSERHIQHAASPAELPANPRDFLRHFPHFSVRNCLSAGSGRTSGVRTP